MPGERPLRIVFMGTPDFAVPALEMLIESQEEVVAVVTQPDRPKGRKKERIPSPVKRVAVENGIPVLQPEKVRDPEALAELFQYEPDLIITAAYGQILPESLLQTPPHGCMNIHASLLPKYRGGAPIHQAIINGEKETGVTIMYMVKALDAGDMIVQRAIPIEKDDHVGTMHDKLSQLGSTLLAEVIAKLKRGDIKAIPQDERQVTYSPNIKREDEKLDWTRAASALADQVRGLHPWPVAYTLWQGEPLKIWWAEAVDDEVKAEPGTIQQIDSNGIVVATGEGCLSIMELQPAGKKRMDVEQFLRGRQLDMGEKLGE
ncbi:methionyl-tRNA formyltransferase [Hazenella sp. IB182357]|uniref:Methionyl-tRNA formyltransferase n=1 Tax=Polycladospora coralii TaxID=2771432 RepID=A0A926NA29_9BACL|nr:methionyl-tRNA formyltransferase [Polycladospora coralii]MBD1371375.1 methionyl-tRNA formyltransferase [Polycladospora coralii]MBS7530343.1 methionyl-tRNA formyltransferase [Polycladospora coralii]